jgi:hypothetical protein
MMQYNLVGGNVVPSLPNFTWTIIATAYSIIAGLNSCGVPIALMQASISRRHLHLRFQQPNKMLIGGRRVDLILPVTTTAATAKHTDRKMM